MKLSILVFKWAFLIYAKAESSPSDDYLVCSGPFCLDKTYDKIKLPPTAKNQALRIGLEFSILQITSVDDKNFQVNLVMYYRTSWDEPRLKYLGNSSSMPNFYTAGLDMTNYIWLPDIEMINLKSTKTLKIMRKFASMM